MDRCVFTWRSSAAALATGVLVAVALGQLLGAPWGLAVITGLPAGAAVLGVAFGARNGLFRTRPRPWGPAPLTGAFLVGQTVVLVPAMLSGVFLELSPATEATLQLLFLLAGFAALMFGYIARMLEQFEAAESAGERSLRSD
ncbi:MAG: hypothetical protein OXG35_06880 [Acidobacteria bacterium]|nr:hypothetical protein [Acidobacteriota bacterium]